MTEDGRDAAERVRDRIEEVFDESPGQRRVVELVLERGFSVNPDGRVVSGGIEVPNTQIAAEAGVDRRVVDATTTTVLDDPELSEVFRKIGSIPSLKNVASVLGLSVMTIAVEDAASSGVIHEITGVIADHGISIRQAVSDDPYFADEPRFTVITDGEVSGDLVEAVAALEFVEEVEIS